MTDLQRFAWLLRRYLAPYWPAVALLVLSSAVATILAGLLPVLMAPILDLALGAPPAPDGTPVTPGTLSLRNLGTAFFQWTGIYAVEDRFRAILYLCLAYVAVGVVKATADFGNYLLALWVRVRAAASMQVDLFRHLLGLSMGFFTRQRTGELVSRLGTDTHAASQGLETIVGTALTAPVLIAFYGFLMVRTSPKMVVAALGAVALHWTVTRLIRGPIRRLATDQFSLLAKVSSHFHEAILSIRVVKSFGAEGFELSGLKQLLRKTLRVNLKFGIYKHAEEPARAVLNYVVEASILLVAIWELLAGRLAVPTFFLFLYVGRAVLVQVGLLGGAYTQLQGILAAGSRLADLFAVRPAVEDGSEPIAEFRDRLALRDVTFHYGAEPVLEGVNLEIRRGEVVALVGPSGSGKSTLADLILRLYDPVAGTVTIDGRDLRSLRQADYRRLFGVVSQEALLFNATIRDNIAYGREGITPADVERAARIANAHEFIGELPDGYDTVVGDRGIRLSGGQRQRVAIARAIVASPPLLVLDEATSALDSESERLVQEAIDRVIQGTTSIVIAHRLSTVLHADKIVVVGGGGVEAIGRHAELLGANETYTRLYRIQFTETEATSRA
ncbi:MAG TPA: ABC transporter ATP-binding protein [Methylomirabilota bacterium]|nr:ABC transporter ATP-binding protein [Methylomirabilota bacterium]